MLIKAINICYNKDHGAIQVEGPTRLENVNSTHQASKVIRAVLRNSSLSPEDWRDYSIHKCTCKSAQSPSKCTSSTPLDPYLKLDVLGIVEGDTLFVRKLKMDPGLQEAHSETINKRHSSSSEQPDITSSKRQKTETSLSLAEVDLDVKCKNICDSISSILGGDFWKSQVIGELGLIVFQTYDALVALEEAVKASLDHPAVSKESRNGSFSSILCKAFIKANAMRNKESTDGINIGERNKRLNRLTGVDCKTAVSLLEARDEESLRLTKEEEQAKSEGKVDFTPHLLRLGVDSKLFGRINRICNLWGNSDWILQPPTGCTSPVALHPFHANELLQIARKTRVQEDEMAPRGFPGEVLKALDQAVSSTSSSINRVHDWTQGLALKLALQLITDAQAGSSKRVSPSEGKSLIVQNEESSLHLASISRVEDDSGPGSSDALQPQARSQLRRHEIRSSLASLQESFPRSNLSESQEELFLHHLEEMEKVLNEQR